MAELSMQGAIILSSRQNLVGVLRTELKNGGIPVSSIEVCDTARDAIEKVKVIDSAVLVIDWEVGADEALEVLAANRKEYRAETHPVFLIAAKLDKNVISAASEYGVNQVHTGEISPAEIQASLRTLISESKRLSPIKQLLIQVEKARRESALDKAENILTQLHLKATDDVRIGAELAECYMQQDRWEDAENLLMTFKNSMGGYARGKHLLARCLLKRGDQAGAIEALESAQLINPYNIERLLELGEIFLNLDRAAEAKEAFNEILAFAPDSKKGKLGKSTSMLALGEVNEALTLLKEAANSRELASVFNTAAIIAIRQNRHGDGLELYRTAISALGHHPKVMARLLYNMGIGYAKWRNVDKSKACFQKACELDPDFADARHNLEVLAKGRKAVRRPMPVAGSEAQDLSHLSEGIGREVDIGAASELSFNTDFDNEFDDDLM